MIDELVIATAEGHRHDLRQLTARGRQNATRADPDPPGMPSAADRRLLAEMGAAAAPVAVEVADPLGVWTLRTPRPRTLQWPGWRTLLGWGVWTALCLLALAYGLGH